MGNKTTKSSISTLAELRGETWPEMTEKTEALFAPLFCYFGSKSLRRDESHSPRESRIEHVIGE